MLMAWTNQLNREIIKWDKKQDYIYAKVHTD